MSTSLQEWLDSKPMRLFCGIIYVIAIGIAVYKSAVGAADWFSILAGVVCLSALLRMCWKSGK